MQVFIGTIIPFGFNFAPQGWAMCNGRLLPISQNQALFSLLGTTYGGDGQSTFALPDLRGRVPISLGQGPGLTNRAEGEVAGVEAVTVLTSQIPSHTHSVTLNELAGTAHVKNAAGNQQSPVGNVPAIEAAGVTATYSSSAPDATMASGAVTVSGSATAQATGGGQPLSVMQPYLVVNYCIALVGIFPSRN